MRKARSALVIGTRAIRSQRWGLSPTAVYGQTFFEGPGCLQGAAAAPVIAGIVISHIAPREVFDMGCGRGALLAAFADRGVAATGCEGSAHGVGMCPSSVTVFQADLRRPIVLNRTYDLVVCIEVAEHLPASAANVLVASIADAADRYVLFAAAGPGEEGDDHINLQPERYWAERFSRHGFVMSPNRSAELREAFIAAGAPSWFRRVLLLQRSDS